MTKKEERKSRSSANGSLKKFHFILNQIHLPKIVNLQIILSLRNSVFHSGIILFEKDTKFQINQRVLDYRSNKALD